MPSLQFHEQYSRGYFLEIEGRVYGESPAHCGWKQRLLFISPLTFEDPLDLIIYLWAKPGDEEPPPQKKNG